MPPVPVRGFGEVALQVNDLETMLAFYVDVVGLSPIRRFEHSAFLKVAGHDGSLQILVLFDRVSEGTGYTVENGARRPPLDHVAFAIAEDDYDAVLEHLRAHDQKVRTVTQPWTGWRSIFVNDPEGNVVEWVHHSEIEDVPEP